MKASLIGISMCLAFCAARAEEKKTYEQDVMDAIDRIAAHHGLSKEEGDRKACALFTDGRYWPVKGGVAVIRDQMFVFAREKNGVSVGGEKVYGADWTSPELFIFAGEKLVGHVAIPKGSEEDVVLALFTPEKIRIFDWKHLSGGFYPRSHE